MPQKTVAGLDCWSPNVGLNRDPRWGRNMEVASEDPLLNGFFGQMYNDFENCFLVPSHVSLIRPMHPLTRRVMDST